MKKVFLLFVIMVVVASLAGMGFSQGEAKKSGEALFKQHCAACHPDGKNIINPKKTMGKNDMEANKIKSSDDIMKLMRNPGPGMVKFDEKTISDKDAQEIAEYILKTFNK
jgi:cytochrome c6